MDFFFFFRPSIKMTSSGRRLLVLDINGTLLDRLSPKTPQLAINVKNEFSYKRRRIFLRPHLDTFLTQITSRFNIDIAIWTSAKRENSMGIVERIFSCLPGVERPRFCWFREEW
jgi:hypothetical protein